MNASPHVLTCLAALLAVGLALHAAAPPTKEVPYPKALADADIRVDTIESILDDALLLGNGDVNALLYAEHDSVVLRLTKNDVWDARLDSKLDPPLPTIAEVRRRGAKGQLRLHGASLLPAGSTWKGPDSYHAHPYPCPRACSVVRIGGSGPKGYWRCIRRQGKVNTFTRKGERAVMRIAGKKGASAGWALGGPSASTDTYSRLRVRLSGSANAQQYVDVLDDAGKALATTGKWQPSPGEPADVVVDLPPGRTVGTVILYVWTTDGEPAENRYEAAELLGKGKASRSLDLSLAAPPEQTGHVRLLDATAEVRAEDEQAMPPIRLRAQADRNVFVIETKRAVTLEGIRSADLGAFEAGTADGAQWVVQKIPGDADWPGMSFAVALAHDSSGGRHVAAIVTSRESPDPKSAAVKLARAALAARPDELAADHARVWRAFWSASGVELGDAFCQNAWYRNLYFLRCVTRRGAVSPGLFASLIHDKPAWHGDYHTNYNIQQTFWSAYVTNHCDLAEPYDRLMREYLPRARWLARQVYGCEGAFYPHVIFAYEPPDPAACKSPGGRQYIHHVWGLTLGVAGFTVQPMWWHYKYAPSRKLLEQTVYPPVRDVADFYAAFLATCPRDKAGKARLGPSVSPEHWGWAADLSRNYNCAFDIAMVRYTLAGAIEGATVLGTDADRIRTWKAALALLPPYPTTAGAKGDPDKKAIVVDVEGAPPVNYNISVPATPVFPGDVVTWHDPPATKDLFRRTIAGLRWNGNNAMIMLGVARARLDMPHALAWLKAELKARTRPNATLTLNRLGAGFNNYGHYTEQFAASMAISELLIQSVGDVVRVFPAWPAETDAAFRHLRTQGGFLVSAQIKAGRIAPVEVTATVDGALKVRTPWPGKAVAVTGPWDTMQPKPDTRGVISLPMKAGQTVTITPADR